MYGALNWDHRRAETFARDAVAEKRSPKREADTTSTKLAAAFSALALRGCGDGGEPFSLREGCYHSEDGDPILRVRGDEGTILTPPPPRHGPNTYSPVTTVRRSPRFNRQGTYVDVAPNILTDANEAATSSRTTRFVIHSRTTRPVIIVFKDASGEKPVMLGPRCPSRRPPTA